MARLTEKAGIPYNEASRAADTVPECRTSMERLGPLLIPEMHSQGLISGARDLNPPSIATITQSQGDPSSENILRGTDSCSLISSAIS